MSGDVEWELVDGELVDAVVWGGTRQTRGGGVRAEAGLSSG